MDNTPPNEKPTESGFEDEIKEDISAEKKMLMYVIPVAGVMFLLGYLLSRCNG